MSVGAILLIAIVKFAGIVLTPTSLQSGFSFKGTEYLFFRTGNNEECLTESTTTLRLTVGSK